MHLLNVFLCCIVNIHFLMNIKYMLYIIATDKCYCDWCYIIYLWTTMVDAMSVGRLGTIRVSVISIGIV